METNTEMQKDIGGDSGSAVLPWGLSGAWSSWNEHALIWLWSQITEAAFLHRCTGSTGPRVFPTRSQEFWEHGKSTWHLLMATLLMIYGQQDSILPQVFLPPLNYTADQLVPISAGTYDGNITIPNRVEAAVNQVVAWWACHILLPLLPFPPPEEGIKNYLLE